MAKKSGMPKYMLMFFITILGGLASWSMYNIINQGIADFLMIYGVENIYLQNLLIIIVIITIFVCIGMSGKKIMKVLSG